MQHDAIGASDAAPTVLATGVLHEVISDPEILKNLSSLHLILFEVGPIHTGIQLETALLKEMKSATMATQTIMIYAGMTAHSHTAEMVSLMREKNAMMATTSTETGVMLTAI